ncbi:hypothetical protein VN0844_08820 [Helicobacter pylori]
MVSLFALYYGVILKTELALNGVFMGNARVFWRYLDFSKLDRFKILTYFAKNFYSLSKP